MLMAYQIELRHVPFVYRKAAARMPFGAGIAISEEARDSSAFSAPLVS